MQVIRTWLARTFLVWSLRLMGDSEARRLLLWHLDECGKQLKAKLVAGGLK